MKTIEIQSLINKTYNKVKNNNSGKNASYIPELATADSKLFGISFVSCNGTLYEAGKTDVHIPIESISKVFTIAMAVDEFGKNEIDKKIGNMGSSLPFNRWINLILLIWIKSK